MPGDNELCRCDSKKDANPAQCQPAHSTHGGRRLGGRVRAGEGGLPRAGGRRLGLHTQSSGSSPRTPGCEGAILEKGFHPAFRQAHPAKILEKLNIPSPPPSPLIGNQSDKTLASTQQSEITLEEETEIQVGPQTSHYEKAKMYRSWSCASVSLPIPPACYEGGQGWCGGQGWSGGHGWCGGSLGRCGPTPFIINKSAE